MAVCITMMQRPGVFNLLFEKKSSPLTPAPLSLIPRRIAASRVLFSTSPSCALTPYAVQHLCLHMHDSHEQHLTLVKRILRYIKGTLHHGLQLVPSPAETPLAYTDADWAGCPDTRRSTSCYCVFLGDNLVSWSSKCQHTVSRSSPEAEYHAVANAVAKSSWI